MYGLFPKCLNQEIVQLQFLHLCNNLLFVAAHLDKTQRLTTFLYSPKKLELSQLQRSNRCLKLRLALKLSFREKTSLTRDGGGKTTTLWRLNDFFQRKVLVFELLKDQQGGLIPLIPVTLLVQIHDRKMTSFQPNNENKVFSHTWPALNAIPAPNTNIASNSSDIKKGLWQPC